VNPNTRPIGIFDSGTGGLSVLRECKRLLPNENFVYLCDREFFPYGNKSNSFIKKRVFALSERLLTEYDCKAIVVACNTATNVGIQMLREKYSTPFVGLEPAIKPALEEIPKEKVVLLTTPVTMRQEKFKNLLSKFDISNLVILPQKDLASQIEDNIDDVDKVYPQIEEILTPHSDAKGIVLGCTHYVFAKPLIEKFFENLSKQIKIFDGNEGAARRLKDLLG